MREIRDCKIPNARYIIESANIPDRFHNVKNMVDFHVFNEYISQLPLKLKKAIIKNTRKDNNDPAMEIETRGSIPNTRK
jgi:hypothetical protein